VETPETSPVEPPKAPPEPQQSLPAQGVTDQAQSAPSDSTVVESHPIPVPARPLWTPDGPTIAAGVVVVIGLALAAWLRGRTAFRGQAHSSTIHSSSRDLPPHLSEVAESLERLIAAADDRIERLERLTAALDDGRGRPGAATGGLPVAERKPLPTPAPATDGFTRRVYELADRGMKPVEIAAELQEHTGKIELMLALRRQATSCSSSS